MFTREDAEVEILCDELECLSGCQYYITWVHFLHEFYWFSSEKFTLESFITNQFIVHLWRKTGADNLWMSLGSCIIHRKGRNTISFLCFILKPTYCAIFKYTATPLPCILINWLRLYIAFDTVQVPLMSIAYRLYIFG